MVSPVEMDILLAGALIFDYEGVCVVFMLCCTVEFEVHEAVACPKSIFGRWIELHMDWPYEPSLEHSISVVSVSGWYSMPTISLECRYSDKYAAWLQY